MQILELVSGYTVRVRGKGPFAFDHITQKYQEHPPVKRLITLATGDEGTWPYEPPEEPPDPSDEEEWAIYVRWRTQRFKNAEIREQSQRARVAFFKVNCIDIIKTPFPSVLVWLVNVGKWIARLFGRVPDKVLFGKRYVKFLDVEVIRSTDDWARIQQAGIVPEVDVGSVLDAANRNFPGDVGRGSSDAGDVEKLAALREAIDVYQKLGGTSRDSTQDVD